MPTLNAFGIVVADMAASLDFYRAVGVDVPAGAEGEPHVDVEIAPGVRLMWDTIDTVRSFHEEWTPPVGGARIGLAFECASPAEVDASYERIVGLGHRSSKAPFDAPWGMRYAVLLDPDDNTVDLYAVQP
jgi:catechol 2,3-dioxygenase-like lactoylglutathione lyase family enzyme